MILIVKVPPTSGEMATELIWDSNLFAAKVLIQNKKVGKNECHNADRVIELHVFTSWWTHFSSFSNFTFFVVKVLVLVSKGWFLADPLVLFLRWNHANMPRALSIIYGSNYHKLFKIWTKIQYFLSNRDNICIQIYDWGGSGILQPHISHEIIRTVDKIAKCEQDLLAGAFWCRQILRYPEKLWKQLANAQLYVFCIVL